MIRSGPLGSLLGDGAPFRSDRRWSFDLAPAELWERITEVQRYRSWWPWLRAFDPGPGFEHGAAWRCEVAPPLPYVVRFTVHLGHVAPERVDAEVSGDVRGRATLTVVGHEGGGCTARLRSELAPANPVLRGFGRVARPLVEWGHEWVLDQGRRQFVERGA